MRFTLPRWVLLAVLVTSAFRQAQAQLLAPPSGEDTVRAADEILQQTMARQIPSALLADAKGVVIVPNVIKIGFIAAVRRGHGVVMIRDANGNWTLPQFITLTGGSVGWQAGVQGTDVVLVFMTQKGVDGLLNGKFTIGADASAAAGPVGRQAAAATDGRLRAEILSYSRSRGLFAGVSLDGSAIETDTATQAAFYSVSPDGAQRAVPESAIKLAQDLDRATQTTVAQPATGDIAPVVNNPVANNPPANPAGPTFQPIPAVPTGARTNLRQQLATSAKQLNGRLDPQWQKFLALPKEVYEGQNPPSLKVMQETLHQYDRVVQSPKYENLVSRPEFQSTYGLLRDYVEELAVAGANQINLPPPPGN